MTDLASNRGGRRGRRERPEERSEWLRWVWRLDGRRRSDGARRSGRRTITGLALAMCTIVLVVACQPGRSIEDVRLMQARGDYEHSIEPLRRMLEGEPESAELHYLLGVALHRTGSPGLAVWPLRKAIEDPQWYWPAAIELVQCAMASENHDLAFRITTEMIERDETRFDAWLFRAEARIARRGEYEEALDDVGKALDLQPESYAAKMTKGSILLLLQRPDEAAAIIGDLERLADSTGLGEPERAKLCVVKASLHEENQKRDEARKQVDDCIERFPTDPLVVQTAVSMLERWDEGRKAQEVLSRAVELEPEMLPFRIALAARLQRAGRQPDAEKLLRDIAEGDGAASQRLAAWVALGDHFLAMDRYADAARAIGHALELNPEPVDSERLAYADLLAMAGEHEEARRAASLLERSEYRDLIEARILLREEQPQAALEKLDRVLTIWPDNAAARYYAARAAEQMGDLERAISEYRASIRADAGFTDAGLRLARMHLARREFQPAIRAAYHHLKAHPGDLAAALVIGEGSLGRNEPIPDELKAVLWSPGARGPWIALQTDRLTRKGKSPDAAIAFLEQIRAEASAAGGGDDAFRSLVGVLVAAGRVKEARRRWEAAAGALPPTIRFELEGVVLRAEGRMEAARDALLKAVEIDPENGPALGELAEVWLALGSPDDAVSCLDRSATSSITPWRTGRRAAAILFDSGRADEARKRLEVSLREHPYDPASVLLLGEICLVSADCRDRVPEIARRAAHLGSAQASRSLMGRFERGAPTS